MSTGRGSLSWLSSSVAITTDGGQGKVKTVNDLDPGSREFDRSEGEAGDSTQPTRVEILIDC